LIIFEIIFIRINFEFHDNNYSILFIQINFSLNFVQIFLILLLELMVHFFLLVVINRYFLAIYVIDVVLSYHALLSLILHIDYAMQPLHLASHENKVNNILIMLFKEYLLLLIFCLLLQLHVCNEFFIYDFEVFNFLFQF